MQYLFHLCVGLFASGIVAAADNTPGDQVIADAIKSLEVKRHNLADAPDKAKVDKAIRELRSLIVEETVSAGSQLDAEVVRKKFGASKTTYFPKTGILKLEYSFPSTSKLELADFDIGQKRVLLSRKSLGIEAADEIKHIVKWKTLTLEATVAGKTMAGVVGGSAGGPVINLTRSTGNLVAGGSTVSKSFVGKSGVPIAWDISAEKVSLKYGTQVMAIPTANKGNHQVFFRGGSDGCAISELVLTVVLDVSWLKQHLATK